MKAENLLSQRLGDPGQFTITLEYTVPDVAEQKCIAEVLAIAELVGEDDRVAGMALTDRVPSLTTHDTVDMACRARDRSGKMPLVHISGKNRDINNFREQIQRLIDNELENALILTGDKARTDLDDPTVLCPGGFLDASQGVDFARKLYPQMFICAAVSSFKYSRASQMMQYMKMQKKIARGANAIFNQVGLDMRKVHELKMYAKANNITTPMVHALYWPSAMLAKLAIEHELPGVVATPEMYSFLKSFAGDADKGKGKRMKILALQIALCRAWGLEGIHLGGLKNPKTLKAILDLSDEVYNESSSPDDLWAQWQQIWKTPDGKPVNTAPAKPFYHFHDDGKGLNSDTPTPQPGPSGASIRYKFMHWIHSTFFEQSIEEGGFMWKLCTWADHHPWIERGMYAMERMCKTPLANCEGCGSCSLPETAYVCTEANCAKHLPNGPCGGSKAKEDECEVRPGITCAWVKVHRQAEKAGTLDEVTNSFVPTKYAGLKGTCSWISMANKQDHRGQETPKTG